MKSLSKYNVTPESLLEGQKLVAELEASRASYLKEKGESQNTTDLKDEAFRKLNSWMSDFKSIARIALEDQPQLLEALGIFVRS